MYTTTDDRLSIQHLMLRIGPLVDLGQVGHIVCIKLSILLDFPN
jgi:hypothetical protein